MKMRNKLGEGGHPFQKKETQQTGKGISRVRCRETMRVAVCQAEGAARAAWSH